MTIGLATGKNAVLRTAPAPMRAAASRVHPSFAP
jgi:hypothetical protein